MGVWKVSTPPMYVTYFYAHSFPIIIFMEVLRYAECISLFLNVSDTCLRVFPAHAHLDRQRGMDGCVDLTTHKNPNKMSHKMR